MCWNAAVSLNTFLFSSFVLVLIIYNNSYTKYKIQELNSVWKYIFIASFVLMQLIEFFIWRNLNNPFYNNLFSTIGLVLLHMQPVASIMIITNTHLRNILLLSYSILAIPYLIYKLITQNIRSVKSTNGHLSWKFDIHNVVFIIWLMFFLFSFVYERKWYLILFALVTLMIAYINYINHNTMASMWCWFINSFMIYYVGYLLFYLPFLEKMKIC